MHPGARRRCRPRRRTARRCVPSRARRRWTAGPRAAPPQVGHADHPHRAGADRRPSARAPTPSRRRGRCRRRRSPRWPWPAGAGRCLDRAGGAGGAEDRFARRRSGGRTSRVRSRRPGRRRAGSTSHGWLVAARTKTPSLSGVDAVELGEQLVDRIAHRRSCGSAALLADARRSRRGTARRALAAGQPGTARACCARSCRCTCRGRRPGRHVMKRAPSSPATARARNVLPQPGGP